MWFWDRKKQSADLIPWKFTIDIHNHLLPGLDDGAEDLLQSTALLNEFQKIGFEIIIPSPHIYSGLYLNSKESISTAFNQVDHSLVKGFAAEYMVDDYFLKLVEQDLICYPNTSSNKYVLIEFPYMELPMMWHESIFELRRKGYQPILAHPERYHFVSFKILEKMLAIGVELQLNVLSLSAYYGKSVQKVAMEIFKNQLYAFAGTDVHHLHHIEQLTKMKHDIEVSEQLNSYDFKNELLVVK